MSSLLVNFNARVADVALWEHRARSSETVCILVEHNRTLVLHKLAFPEHPVHLSPSTGSSLQFDTCALKPRPQRICRLPCIVMRDLARHVVKHVRLRNAVRCRRADEAHHGTEVTQECAVKRRECTTGEGEFRGTVMRKERVGMLQERNEH